MEKNGMEKEKIKMEKLSFKLIMEMDK